MPKKFLLIDTSALIHRAFHALPPFTKSSGQEVGALFGLAATLLKVLKEERPDFVAAALDLPKPTFRHKLYRQYKATRAKTPETLVAQIQEAPKLLEGFGIPQFAKEGYEADDVIATIVHAVGNRASNINVLILTGDLDALQLVNDWVTVAVPQAHRRGVLRRYDPKELFQRFGVLPQQMVDFKVLVGDPSDNIPGVPGVGPKTAAGLLKEYQSLQLLLAKGAAGKVLASRARPGTRASTVRGRRVQKLSLSAEKLGRLRQLVELKKNVPLDFSLERCQWQGLQTRQLSETLSRFGFRALLARIQEAVTPVQRETSSPMHLDSMAWVRREQEILGKITAAEQAGLFSSRVADLERKVLPVIHAMEQTGILLDVAYLAQLKQEFIARRKTLEEKIFTAAGTKFNPASSQQVARVLFEELGLATRGLRKTSSGARVSAAASELEKLKGVHAVVPLLIEWREVAKLLSTYIEALPRMVDPGDQRLHTTFDPLGTETGRVASRNPNLQNIPKRSALGKRIRDAFIAPPGYELVSLDYSQIELRVAAVLARDRALLEIFERNQDVHTMTAARLFGVAVNEVTPAMRERAKTINFGVLYGIGPRRLAEESGLSFEEAQEFIASYFTAFPGIARYVAEAKEKAKNNGYAETFFGRRRLLPGIWSASPRERAQAERIAVNMPVQGTATGDLIKMAMVAIGEDILKNNHDVKLLLQVHDELLFEFPQRRGRVLIPQIRAVMERPMGFPLALRVNVSSGMRWGSLVEYTQEAP